MTTVEIDHTEYKVAVWGHAGYSETGGDIVCAAMSILYFTLADTLKRNRDKFLDLNIEQGDGSVTIRCVPQEGYASLVDTILEMFTNGARLMHENYPNNVLLILKG